MDNFIKRSFLLEQIGISESFDNVIKNRLSIILGEPASGKTCQFEQFEVENKDTVIKENLVNINNFDIENISPSIKTILFDSIDEALEDTRFKQLASDILNIIGKIHKINSDINIVISCRYFEWKTYYKEVFSSKFEDTKVYYLEDIKENEINSLLSLYNIDKVQFWDWVNINHLKNIISKNILVLTNIVKDFNNYKKEKHYTSIYKKIILKLTTIQPNDRELIQELKSISSDEKLKILSSLSIYMSLNFKIELDKSEISNLDSDLYKIKDININHTKLELLFKTGLFKGSDEKVSFKHQTFQEFLSAYFIYERKLDFLTIKEVFANRLDFYERFEEIIIYLVELDKDFFYFNNIVRFNPFVYRRNTKLNEIQKEILVKNILSYTKDEYLKTKVKQLYVSESELNKIDLPNIVNILRDNIDIKNITKETYQYITGIYNYQYSKELKKLIIEIWNTHLSNKDKLFELLHSDDFKNINDTFENIKYCEMMNNYLIKNKLMNEDIEFLKYRIFMTLYSKVDFNKLIQILKSEITFYELSLYFNMIKKLSISDLKRLSLNVIRQIGNIKLDSRQYRILSLSLIRNYHLLDKDISLYDIEKLIVKVIEFDSEFFILSEEIEYYKDISIENKVDITIPPLVKGIIKFIESIKINKTDKIQNKVEINHDNKTLKFNTISNKLKSWIGNQNLDLAEEFYPIMRDKIKSMELTNLSDFNTYLIDIYNKNHNSLKDEIKTVIMQFISLDKANYEYIKKYWKEDIVNNYFYFTYMIITNTNEAINEFRKDIFDNKNIEIKLDIFNRDNIFDKSDMEINIRNKMKYLLTSINYIYKPKRQHNFLANVEEISDENIEFILEYYFKCFNKYVYPKKTYRLDEYAEMVQSISQIFNSLKLDTKRVNLLEEFLIKCHNHDLEFNIKKTLESLYNLRIQNGYFSNSYYKDIFDSYKIEKQKSFIDELYSTACTILDKQKNYNNEDDISMEFRDLLNAKGYRISMQDPGGESKSGKKYGERDLILKDNLGVNISILEAIKIKAFNQSNIKDINEHYERLLSKYDLLGNQKNYLLVYYHGEKFDEFLDKYKKNFVDLKEVIDDNFDKSNIKVYQNYTKRGNSLFHLVLNFSIS